MRYLALACDYDGTLAHHGQVDGSTLAALERLRASGRKLLLVTGRELDDLHMAFPHTGLFDLIVVENGALLYNPATRKERLLGEAPPAAFITRLRERGVAPMSVGRVIVATWHPHENEVMAAIRDLGLELQVIFNKGAVMVLPAGVNKASGLRHALAELSLSPHNVIGVGDAENDHAFISACECGVAVQNALPMLKERADVITEADHGAGVTALIDELVRSDLRGREAQLRRHDILLGTTGAGQEVRLHPYGQNVLIAGSSGGGKSTIATGLMERLAEQGYQICIIDPEGDYVGHEGAVVLGDAGRPPAVTEVLALLGHPDHHAAVNLLGVPLADRPAFFAGLLPRLQEMRARTGRPHWILIDEAHHLLPASRDNADLTLPRELHGTILLTVHPEHVDPAVLSTVDLLLVTGKAPAETLAGFSRVVGRPAPDLPAAELDAGEAILWPVRTGAPPLRIRSVPPRSERRRHVRKYAHGELDPDRSFYFRGPEGALHLRAQNLMIFLQMADGVDDGTWMHHLRQGDYSRWFREGIKDEELAQETEPIERRPGIGPKDGRALVRALVEKRYTHPA